MCVCVRVCVCVCMFVCLVCAYVCVCMYVCVCGWVGWVWVWVWVLGPTLCATCTRLQAVPNTHANTHVHVSDKQSRLKGRWSSTQEGTHLCESCLIDSQYSFSCRPSIAV